MPARPRSRTAARLPAAQPATKRTPKPVTRPASKPAGKRANKTAKKKPRVKTAASRATAARAEADLRAFALSFPETREEFPWGERVVKVRKKVFVFMGISDGGLGLSVKLPRTGRMALLLPFAQPTGYGLGKSGWVSARFARSEAPPVALLREWIEESYRAVAPTKLSKKVADALGDGAGDETP